MMNMWVDPLESVVVTPSAPQALEELSLLDLRAEWKRVYSIDAPRCFRSSTLIKAIAYERQAQAYGDLPAGMQRELLALAKPMVERPAPNASQAFDPGARLLRTWKGVLHEVIARQDGFEWRGDLYPSLSRIAREITGTRWNGPRFFGLRQPVKVQPTHG